MKDDSTTNLIPAIIEERIIKVNGDVGIRSYMKTQSLGRGGFAEVFRV